MTQYNNEYREKLLNENGSIWIYDTLYLFAIPPVSFLSLIGNMLAYSILSRPYFNHKPLYTYLRAICLNSSVYDLITIMNVIWMPRRHLDLANSELAAYLQCYLKFPIIFSTYLYGCLLDIILAIDRLFELTNRKHKFKCFQPYRICIILLIVSYLLNSPLFFLYEAKKQVIFVDVTTNRTEYLNHFGETQFALTRPGKVIKNCLILIRDVLPVIFLVITNITSLIVFKRIYRNNECPIVSKLSRNRHDYLLKVNFANSQSKIECKSRREIVNSRNVMTKWHFRVSQANKMLTKMVLIICGISTVEHILVTLGVFLYATTSGQLRYTFLFLANVAALIKNSSNIFIFYNYNKFFKTRFLERFSCLMKKFEI